MSKSLPTEANSAPSSKSPAPKGSPNTGHPPVKKMSGTENLRTSTKVRHAGK